MNLLKIFTYSGIIEVFVIPHILPCIVALIPNNITDMVELGVGIVSGLFPRVVVNVESEVLLRVWRDRDENAGLTPSVASSKNGGNEASSSNVSTDSKSDNGSSPDGFCNGTKPPPESQSKDDADPGKCWKPKPDDAMRNSYKGCNGQNKDTTQPSTSAPSSSNECKRLNCPLNKNIAISTKPVAAYHPRYTCTIEGSVSSSSDQLDTFCRSCSVEYYVKPPTNERYKSQNESVQSKSCTSCEVEDRNEMDEKNPQFCKSCSLEYVTKFDDDKKKDDRETKTPPKDTNSEKVLYQSLIKSPVDFKQSFADREIMPDFGWKSKGKNWKQVKFSEKHGTTTVETREVKPIYFGDNYKNL